jgi:hypothetical protein
LLGKVKVEIDSQQIVLKNINNIFRNETNIPIGDFHWIELRKEQRLPPVEFWGFTKGDIVLKYRNGQRRFGKGLDEKESYDIIRKIEGEIRNHAQHALATSRPRPIVNSR